MFADSQKTSSLPKEKTRFPADIRPQHFIGIAIAIVLLVGSLSIWTVRNSRTAERLVRHTYDIILLTDKTLSTLIGFETRYRGYALTGGKEFIEPLNHAQTELQTELSDLEASIGNNLAQRKRMGELRALIAEKIRFGTRVVKMRSQHADVADIVSFVVGKGIMDQIRGKLSEIQDQERQLLEERTTAARREMDALTFTIIFIAVISVVFLGWSNVTVQKNFQLRLKTEKALQEAHEGLEQKVAQRTSELDKVNMALQRSNGDLSRFASITAHDLKEPLRTVSMFTRLLASTLGDKLDGEQREFAAFVVDGATRMQRLIDDLLAYAGVDSIGNAKLDGVDAELPLKNAIKNLQAVIQETGATISVGELPTIRCRSTLVTQLFQNLIANALKFHAKPTPVIRIEAKPDGAFWIFSVSDNGIGFDKAQAEQIFEMFRRLHSREDYPGTGLGLATCKKIAELHGGRIWAESEPGKGSTFYFTLPDAGLEAKKPPEIRRVSFSERSESSLSSEI